MTGTTTDWLTQIMAGVVVWVLQFADAQLAALIGAFGSDTEPDFNSVVGVYDRMLAISLLIAGGIIASALIERVAGGSAGSAGTCSPVLSPRSSSPSSGSSSFSTWRITRTS